MGVLLYHNIIHYYGRKFKLLDQVKRQQVLDRFLNKIGRINSRLMRDCIDSQDSFYHMIMDMTSFVRDREFKDRVQMIKLNISKDPTCAVCGKFTKFVHMEGGKPGHFRETCGTKCAGVYKLGVSIIRDEDKAGLARAITMTEKYGYAYNSQRPEIKPLLGLHNSDEDFRKRHSIIQKSKNASINYDVLDDINQLVELNKTKTIKQIADMLGCSKGLVYNQFWAHGVDTVSHTRTNIELMIEDILIRNNINFKTHDRETMGNGKELDFNLFDHNLAIECNGCRWHREEKVGTYFHRDKTDLCEKKGFKLLHFFDREFDDIELLEDIIKREVNKSTIIIDQSDCELVDVTIDDGIYFIEEFDLKRIIKSGYQYKGMVYNDELVSVCVYETIDNKIAIRNICTRKGFKITNQAKSYMGCFKSDVRYYADRRFNSIKELTDQGLVNIGVTEPDYYITNSYTVCWSEMIDKEYSDKFYKVCDSGYAIFTL